MSFITYETLKALGKAFSLKTSADIDMFDDLWEVYQVGNKFKRDNEDDLKQAVRESYKVITDIVSGKATSGNHGFDRGHTTTADKLVIFSDHHMTHKGHRHDYFRQFNFNLYLKLLQHYGDKGFTLVENGDVEELVIFEPTKAETLKRRKMVRRPTLGMDDVGEINWDELVGARIELRKQMLEKLFQDNKAYYDLVKSAFGRGRYIKVSGNHDAYASNELEGMIESMYWRGVVKDFVLVKPPSLKNLTKFVITHGHQFDESCVPPFAKKVGETISECVSWSCQGPDRIWKVSDTRKWTSFENKKFLNNLSTVHQVSSSKPDLESVLEAFPHHDVAWEYFENDDPYTAFVKEVCTGDEFFKFRHMNETTLFNAILLEWSKLPVFPTLICGHTHEARDRAKFNNTGRATARVTPPDTTDVDLATRYMNTGSAGRFENLIWCIEIEGDKAAVYSWSNTGTSTNFVLQKVKWTSNDRGMLEGQIVRS